MDIVFCGTPEFAVPTLRALVEAGFRVRLVVTQPDRPRGRGMEVAASPVKQLALDLGLPVAQPDKIRNNEEFRAQLEALQPRAIVVVAYGRIIPPWMIALPALGNLNLHASLLPQYRGAAPIQWAIANGDTVTGVTTMRIDAGLDTGDLLLVREAPILPDDTAPTLAHRLAALGAPLMVETLRGLDAGSITPRPQDHARATLAPLLTKEDGRIDFIRTARAIHHRLRGFQPWPGAWTTFRGKTLNVWSARPVEAPGFSPVNKAASETRALAPGELCAEGDHLLVGCGATTRLELLELQPEGKRRISARDFVNGYKPQVGERFGSP